MRRAIAPARPSDPGVSAFVSAHAGTGKTYTLVERVTRLLLAGADPGAILCVTYTKAGAAEMQRRLFSRLGELAVLQDDDLRRTLADLGEAERELSEARALFARALETPGGLKIQTIHAFCERLLRRFPVEAGLSPRFTVMDDQAADTVARRARDAVAMRAGAHPDEPIGGAYRRMSVELDFASFNDMFAEFARRRTAIGDYARACELQGGAALDVWRRCGFDRVRSSEWVADQAMARIRWRRWREVAQTLLAGRMTSDRKLGERMAAMSETTAFTDVWALFSNQDGSAKGKLVTAAVDEDTRAWLVSEQARHGESWARLVAARVAEDTAAVLTLGAAYVSAYETAKREMHALDFEDLVTRTLSLLTERADAAWVLFKLDNGIAHVLLDEAQDTSPEQWRILTALTDEFFHGEGAAGATRTVFVVGDEKQSIFSFQGARPERLAQEAQDLERRALAAGLRFSRVNLIVSRRSTAEVLAVVDQVFADREAAIGLVSPAATLLRLEHKAHRHVSGSVDLWPLEIADEEPERDPLAPVDAGPARSANKRLARRIAIAIREMVDRGEAIADEDTDEPRPCRWGDFLILVRRRGILFDAIIRALKASGVPIAGADRLKLSEHGLHADLMTLGQFARFPADDLALAGLLRSPFCDVDETSLFDLAHARSGRLWTALGARARERREWAEAASFLAWAKAAASAATPFEFYGLALNRRDAEGRSMRQRLLTRLGGEAEEALDGFLAQCLAAEAAGVRDMERFVDWMAATEIEIKRESSERANEVRVMTTHGAKGLEAPIVILPDTASRLSMRPPPLIETEDGGFLWAPRKKDDCEASFHARGRREEAIAAEYNRLLYVALTRARDRLIVCGIRARRGHDSAFNGSWGDFVARALSGLESRVIAVPGEGDLKGLRFGAEPQIAAAIWQTRTPMTPLPGWIIQPAQAEPGARLSAPSRLDEDDRSAATSPLDSTGGLGRWRRGEIIHRLLQVLPDLAPGDWDQAAGRLLAREAGLDESQRGEIIAAALGVLRDERFSAVFGPGSRAEAPIAGRAATLPPDLIINGRVDRLVLAEDRVLVVDYKTNRPAPHRVEEADSSYIRQMAIYTAVLGEIFPGRRIEAALIWTDGPKLMLIPEPMLKAALENLAA